MKSVLSTKKLSIEQKAPFLKAGLNLVEHDFIRIDFIPFELPQKIENVIFTSQNTVKALKNKGFNFRNPDLRCFCVGKKTKSLLEENGAKVEFFTHYGQDLAHRIVEQCAAEKFLFFCGNRRREEMPSIFKKHYVEFQEVTVYNTVLNPKRFRQSFNAVLFFSPSGVEGFCLENEIHGATAFCIGTTTAKAAQKCTEKITVAEEPTIESVISKILERNNNEVI